LSTSSSTTRLARLRTPSSLHRIGRELLGDSASLPVLTTAPWLVRPDKPLPETPPWLERPMTPLMRRELAGLVFKQREDASAAVARAEAEARAKALRRAKTAPGPKVLRISRISCEDLPDADRGVGGGTSDPFLEFEARRRRANPGRTCNGPARPQLLRCC
jgi:hypothetical protein